jgi:non-ribosomal peptide synthetase component E (peptide arylation enzyme)
MVTAHSWQFPEEAPLEDLWSLVEWRAAETPSAVFATTVAGRSITFGGYHDAARRTAGALAARGIGGASVVAWQLPTEIEAVVLMGALALLDAVQIPLLASHREREVRAMVEATPPDLMVVPGIWRGFDHADLARRVAQDADLLVLDENGLPEGDPVDPLPQRARAGASRWVFATSGTTASPKGVCHSDATIVAAAVGTCEASMQIADDVYLLVTPIAHVGGAVALCSGLLTGCRSVLVPTYRPGDLADLVHRERVTLAAGPLTVQMGFLESNRQRPAERLFATVRAYPIGGAPRPPELHRRIRDELGGSGLLSGYGMTECPIATKGRIGDPDGRLAATEGRPTRGVLVRITRPDGAEAGPGEEGAIRVRGPQLFLGYVDAALDTDALDDRGAFRTGDLGRLDEDGFLTVTGRLKDVIIRKGENISAAELEHLIRAHPDVADVAVIGIPDPEVGERACAVVEMVQGRAPLSLPDVVAYLEAVGLMRQKLPERLEILSALPRNAFGKADKQTLRSRYGGTA